MPLRVLFVDMNSYFASVEQQDRRELRGKPVVVAAVNADSTCCIAASREAKLLGVRTGTVVWQARQFPGMQVIEARPELYIRTHRRILQAIETCVPVHSIESIDECSCRLNPEEGEPPPAMKLAHRIKCAIREQVGECLTCSIGLAPNKKLAKLAADAQKPDGLYVITTEQLPHALDRFKLDDLPGVGPRMLKRLNSFGVGTIAQLYEQSESRLKEIWNSIVGSRWWHWLRGYDLPEPPTHRGSVGHSHVLPPEDRTQERARAILIKMIHKAAARLRSINYWAGHMEIYVSFSFREEGWRGSVALGLCQDTQTMIEAFNDLWPNLPWCGNPTQVAVTLFNLVPNQCTSAPLFPLAQRRLRLARALDRVNSRFGKDMAYFGGMHGVEHAAPTRIAFTQIPDIP